MTTYIVQAFTYGPFPSTRYSERTYFAGKVEAENEQEAGATFREGCVLGGAEIRAVHPVGECEEWVQKLAEGCYPMTPTKGSYMCYHPYSEGWVLEEYDRGPKVQQVAKEQLSLFAL